MTGSPRHADSGPKGQADQAGFALLEALVAIAITLGLAGLLFQVLLSGQGADARLDAQRRASVVAQSLMDRIGGDIPLRTGQTVGVVQDLNWRVEIAAYQDQDTGASALMGNARLVEISVVIAQAERSQPVLALSSLRTIP